ncbi:MAG: hypothetical protein EBZ74_08220 [Planctomycetia bacterium]|nr:hypothetical protein [Planctomycetia bacterium]
MTGESGAGEQAGLRTVWEIAAVALVFAAAAAWPAPDINEAVYLTKARHAADPAWAAGDFFLETPDAHGVFYLLFRPVAAALPLEQTAWMGRLAGWLAVAVGFWHAAAPLVGTTWGRLVAAALFSLALRHTTLAGEWVLGGCEAKVFAWALVLGGVGEWARGRFATAWLLCGAATAWHPIVGGWALVALVLARGAQPWERPLARDALLVAAGLAVAAAGIVPALALSGGADAATRAAAARIYVVERLHHHLLPRTFAEAFVARHLLAVLAWWLLDRLATPSPARRRVAAFTLAALAISTAGLVISLLEPVAPDVTFGLLRFYWFRLADVIVPLALATSAAAVLEDRAACGRASSLPPGLVRAGVTLLVALDVAAQSAHWPLPGRDAPTPRADAKVDAAAWADVCAWVHGHTPAAARFLTPRGSATFTWRTDRPEVVAWKNSPQDAASLVAWRKRITDCFAARDTLVGMEQSTAALGADRVRLVADRYGATHAIVPLDAPRLAEMPGERIYANACYAVYDLGPAAATEPR